MKVASMALALLFSGIGTWQEPSEEAAVLATVQRFFDAMTAADPAASAETLLLEGQFVSVRETDDGVQVRTTAHGDYMAGLRPEGPTQEERMWEPQVMVHGRLAMVWTPYDFHRDDQLSHCGIDAFSLVKTADGWKIAGVTYTVEPAGCAALGQPPRAPR